MAPTSSSGMGCSPAVPSAVAEPRHDVGAIDNEQFQRFRCQNVCPSFDEKVENEFGGGIGGRKLGKEEQPGAPTNGMSLLYH